MKKLKIFDPRTRGYRKKRYSKGSVLEPAFGYASIPAFLLAFVLLAVSVLMPLGGAGTAAATANAATVNAASGASASLTLNNAISGAYLRLYQVRVLESDGTYTTTENFQNYSVDYDVSTQEEMRSLCNTLASYTAAEDVPAADDVQKASADGTAVFSNLVPGMYLVTGDSGEVDGTMTHQVPVLTYLPAEDSDGNITYDVAVSMKQETPQNTTSYTVYKVWSDNNSSSRPTSIQVQLSADGTAVGSVITLNSENNWKYTWKNLEIGPKYTVTEVSVPSGYTVSISEESKTFTIRNTSKTPNTPKTPGSGTSGKLPQTGQLWWPVPILVFAGLLFFTIGMIKRRASEA